MAVDISLAKDLTQCILAMYAVHLSMVIDTKDTTAESDTRHPNFEGPSGPLMMSFWTFDDN